MEKLTIQEFSQFMDRWLNNFDDFYQFESLYQSLIQNHPTLQQNFWRTMERVIVRYADRYEKDGRYYDDRNAASVKFCSGLAKFIRENDFYFPVV